MHRPARIAAVTGALVVAGAVSGAGSGVVAMTVAVLVYLHVLPNAALLGLSAGLAAVIGACTLPVLGWGLLRTVPLRAAVLGTSLGTALGGAAGFLVGAAAVNPYLPFAVSRSPFPECAVGAVAGAALAAGAFHIYYRRRRADIGVGAG